jgi:hypothetical protein
MELLVSLLGPKVLGALGAMAAAGVAVLVAYFRGRSAGKAGEQARQAQATLDLVADEKAARESVEELTADEAKRELSEWSR